MRTDKQNEASRRNGAKSKGPVTEEGKAKSSLNGTTHGLSGSHRFLYNNERDDRYQELLTHYMTLFAPANGVEEDLVVQIVVASWRMKRIDNIEAAVVDVQMEKQRKWVDKDYKDIDADTRQGLAFQTKTVGDTVALSGRYHARALRSYNTAYKILRELQRDRLKRETQVTPAATQQLPSEPKKAQPAPAHPFIYEPVPSQVPADIVVAAIPLQRESNSRMIR
jgi:hypothetical protein